MIYVRALSRLPLLLLLLWSAGVMPFEPSAARPRPRCTCQAPNCQCHCCRSRKFHQDHTLPLQGCEFRCGCAACLPGEIALPAHSMPDCVLHDPILVPACLQLAAESPEFRDRQVSWTLIPPTPPPKA